MKPRMYSRIRRCFPDRSFSLICWSSRTAGVDRNEHRFAFWASLRDHTFDCQYCRVTCRIPITRVPGEEVGRGSRFMGTGLEDIRMPPEEQEGPKRALIVSAHPDDSEFGAAGTAHLWGKDGWEFHYLICTDGSKGSDDPEMTPDRLVPLRRQEQRAAAALLGVRDVFFLDHVDGELAYTRQLLRDVVRYIRRLRPYAVFTHDPSQIVRNMFVNHPDHRCAGTVALDAVYPFARNRPSFPELLDEGLEPFSVREVYLWSVSEVNFSVDITDVLEVKFEALRQHNSQFQDFGGPEERLRQFWRDEDGRFQERFRRIQLPF